MSIFHKIISAGKPLVMINALFNIVIVYFFIQDSRYLFLDFFPVSVLFFQILGISLAYSADYYKAGSVIYYISAAFFLPVSIIGIIGMHHFLKRKRTAVSEKEDRNMFNDNTTDAP